jgi:hypothetical protein
MIEAACRVQTNGRLVGDEMVFHNDMSNAECVVCGGKEKLKDWVTSKAVHRELRFCAECSSNALYCGRECQTAHWKLHRPVCKRGANIMLVMRGVAGTELKLASGVLSVV